MDAVIEEEERSRRLKQVPLPEKGSDEEKKLIEELKKITPRDSNLRCANFVVNEDSYIKNRKFKELDQAIRIKEITEAALSDPKDCSKLYVNFMANFNEKFHLKS